MTGKDLNKRVIENFIKAGALDGLGGYPASAHDDLRFSSWIRWPRSGRTAFPVR